MYRILFMPRSLPLIEHHVRQHDTLRISDHFPVVATVKISEEPTSGSSQIP